MIRTHIQRCHLKHAEADALNRESARIYGNVLKFHWRTYRHVGHWLSINAACRWEDRSGPTILHAHSRDAAQQAFYHACKIAKAKRGSGAKFPHHLPLFRTTIWKNTGIRRRQRCLLLARARGLTPITVPLTEALSALPPKAFKEVRLKWNKAGRYYEWHIITDDGVAPLPAVGQNTLAVDLGEIHPAACTDGASAMIITCRELRSNSQYTAKRLAELSSKQARLHERSRRWRRLQRRRSWFLAQQERRQRDILHKVSRAIVVVAQETDAATIALGDLRNIGDSVALGRHTNQKVSQWPHGRLCKYITYKAGAVGIMTVLVEEHHTTKTCPACGHEHQSTGRLYRCPACGLHAHRDVVGAANILSRHRYGALARISPPTQVMYRIPFNRRVLRSRLDTAQVA